MSKDKWIFDVIRKSREREAARLAETISGLGIDPAVGVGYMFRNWVTDAQPEEVVDALQKIARQPTPALKRLKAAEIAGVWE